MSTPTRLDTGAGTRLDPLHGDGKTRIDRPEGSGIVAGVLSIPRVLASSYRLVEPIPTQGAEADLFIVEALLGGDTFVLKLYRRGLKPKADVIELIRRCDREHVIQMIDWGESDGLWYEILEYGKHGSLRRIFQEGPVKNALMLSIVRELHSAVEHIHSHNIIHRDLKPENILVRTLKPIDLMLADFGIASLSDATQHFTTKSRTIKYGAPESAAGAVGDASDYWSLGLIVLEGLLGRHPFDSLSDMSIALLLATKGVDVSEVKDARWRGLCKGLLTRDPKKRWGCEQIAEWINGGMPEIPGDEPERPSQKPYKIAKRECWIASDLALEFGLNWQEAEKHLARNLVLPWLRDELRDQDAANLLIDLTENRSLKVEDRLVRLVANLGKGLPPVWRGLSLDQATLVTLCREAIGGDVEKAKLLDAMSEKGILDVWGESGNETCLQWAKQWKSSAEFFSASFEQISDEANLGKSGPDRRTLLPSVLLMILSSEYREATRVEVAGIAEQVSRCSWLASMFKEENTTALLVVQAFHDEAISYGNREIRSANVLSIELASIERDYVDLLANGTSFTAEIQTLRESIRENHAFNALTESLPDLKRRMFDAARSQTVANAFRRMRSRMALEVLADGLLVSCLFVVLRVLMGNVIADDGFSPLSARLFPKSDAAGQATLFLFAGCIVLAFAWGGLRWCARRLANQLFGQRGVSKPGTKSTWDT